MATLTAVDKSTGKKTGWDVRHNDAVIAPGRHERIVKLFKAWGEYAEAFRAVNEIPIGEDGYCGPYFEEIGHGLNGLLSADIGRLDGRTLNTFYLDTLKENGCKGDF